MRVCTTRRASVRGRSGWKYRSPCRSRGTASRRATSGDCCECKYPRRREEDDMAEEPREPAPAEEQVGGDQVRIPDSLPVLPLRSAVVFPLAVVPLAVGRPGSVKLVNDAMRANRFVALIAQKNDAGEETDPKELHTVGTFAVIHQLARAADGTLRIVVQGLERIRVVDYVRTEPYLVARV